MCGHFAISFTKWGTLFSDDLYWPKLVETLNANIRRLQGLTSFISRGGVRRDFRRSDIMNSMLASLEKKSLELGKPLLCRATVILSKNKITSIWHFIVDLLWGRCVQRLDGLNAFQQLASWFGLKSLV